MEFQATTPENQTRLAEIANLQSIDLIAKKASIWFDVDTGDDRALVVRHVDKGTQVLALTIDDEKYVMIVDPRTTASEFGHFVRYKIQAISKG